MFTHVSALAWRSAALLCLVTAPAFAQPDNVNFRFNSGQPIQPIYEGWERKADRTIEMYFGYINRNYTEELAIAVGAGNGFSPGAADRGQPTLFRTRIHRQLFSVKLPANWGKTQELTWTITANGRTLRAIGWMQPEWEIDAETGGQIQNEEGLKNQPPSLAVAAPEQSALSQPLTLTATVVDDGLPKPRGKRKPIAGADSPPTLRPNPGDPEVLINVPGTTESGEGRRAPASGPKVEWVVWRGPANVVFAPRAIVDVKDGAAVATATFRQPGVYVLRATANDGALSSPIREITITVAPQ